MKIESINLPALRNAEFLQFSNDGLTIIQTNDPAALSVTPWYTAFKTVTDRIAQLFKTDTASALTDDVLTADARRDNAVTGIYFTVQGYTYHFTPAMATAAKTIQDYLAIYGGGIARENYQSETAIIANIAADLKGKPELLAAVSVLGLDSWVTELDTANKDFNTKYLARTQEMGAVTPDTIKAKRQEAAEAWKKLKDKLNAYYEINEGAEPWAKTVNSLNALIAQYNTLVNGRKGGDTTGTTSTNQP